MSQSKIKRALLKIHKFIFDADYRTRYLNAHGCFDKMPDAWYLKRIFKAYMGRPLDLKNPEGFNAKLQWLKLYDRKPEHTLMVDKYLVRDFIKEKLGEEYLIPLLGVWDDPDKIDFDRLPEKFVLKCNHNSGLGMCICSDKSKLDIPTVRSELRKGMEENYYLKGREWPYKNVPRKIVCEAFIVDETLPEGASLTDYKFYCFNGVVDCVMACIERNTGNPRFFYFDKQWNLRRNYNVPGHMAPEDFSLPKPKNFDKMLEIAALLSEGCAHVRVDLYNCNGKIYFGELTFFSDSGIDNEMSDYLDKYWGNLLSLPPKTT